MRIYILIGINVLVIFTNIVIFSVIKFNNLKHLSKEVEEIKKNVEENSNKLDVAEKDIVKIKTTLKI